MADIFDEGDLFRGKLPNYDGSLQELMMEELDTGFIILSCGCRVKPDGRCDKHGNGTPYVEFGFV